MFGAIEAGGTKIVCAVGTGPDDLRRESFATTTPGETISRMSAFFADHPIKALGVASFGPIDLQPDSPTYGYITSTPKKNWQNTDLLGTLRRALPVPVAFDTDVNAAALGEQQWGSAIGLSDVTYVTIGTGVGGGAIVNGAPVHGLIHPEMGHMRIPRDPAADPFPGLCPFHGDCLEGLVSGPAIAARAGRPASSLEPEHPIWLLIARYLGLACANWCVTLSPQRIILGGGVMHQQHLFPLVRGELSRLLNGYVQSSAVQQKLDQYIVPPGLHDNSGVLGALAMASRLR